MNDSSTQATVTLVVVLLGVLLYLLVSVWTPSALVVGPLQLGDHQGDCHGLKDGGGGVVYVELCK